MSRAPSSLLERLRALPKRPTDEHLAPCIEALISYGAASRHPAMSAAALLRSQRDALAVPGAVVQRLSAAVTEHFRAERRKQDAIDRRSRDHLPLKTAAAVLGENEADLRVKLIDPAQRRLYGWPYWNGATFMLPILACRAATRAAFLASLPATEPAAIADTLPAWCRRQGAGEVPAGGITR